MISSCHKASATHLPELQQDVTYPLSLLFSLTSAAKRKQNRILHWTTAEQNTDTPSCIRWHHCWWSCIPAHPSSHNRARKWPCNTLLRLIAARYCLSSAAAIAATSTKFHSATHNVWHNEYHERQKYRSSGRIRRRWLGEASVLRR